MNEVNDINSTDKLVPVSIADLQAKEVVFTQSKEQVGDESQVAA